MDIVYHKEGMVLVCTCGARGACQAVPGGASYGSRGGRRVQPPVARLSRRRSHARTAQMESERLSALLRQSNTETVTVYELRTNQQM